MQRINVQTSILTFDDHYASKTTVKMGKLITVGILSMAFLVYWEMFYYVPFDPKAIEGQRILITGYSTGIGEQVAYQYAELGARLMITARSEHLLKKVVERCVKLGAQQVHYVVADMAIPEDRSKVVANVEKHLGGLDQLILNHAMLEQGWWEGSAANLTLLEQMLRVNFLSFTDVTSKALPMLVASRGRIGVVSGFVAELPTVKSSMYSASKLALHGFFSSLRQEMLHKKKEVSVTIVVLGGVITEKAENIAKEAAPHLPKKFMMTPVDAARAVMESVFQRRYRYACDWKFRALLVMNSYCPQFMEDATSFIIMNDDGHLFARLLLFLFRTVYAD